MAYRGFVLFLLQVFVDCTSLYGRIHLGQVQGLRLWLIPLVYENRLCKPQSFARILASWQSPTVCFKRSVCSGIGKGCSGCFVCFGNKLGTSS